YFSDEGFFNVKEEIDLGSGAWCRSVMAKQYSVDWFVKYVGESIQTQLKLWDSTYEVKIISDLMAHEDYVFVIDGDTNTYEVRLSGDKAEFLKLRWAFGLDIFLWKSLKRQGLIIGEERLSYLNYCGIY